MLRRMFGSVVAFFRRLRPCKPPPNIQVFDTHLVDRTTGRHETFNSGPIVAELSLMKAMVEYDDRGPVRPKVLTEDESGDEGGDDG